MAPKKNVTKKDGEKIKKQEIKTTETKTEIETKTETETGTKIETENEELNFDISIQPMTFEIKKSKDNIFNSEPNIQLSENINYPKFEYGFHHFIHQSKNYLNAETAKFEGKKKVWNVLNKYEPVIDNYSDGISELSKKYFQEVSKTDIVNYSFFKMWELFMYFDLIDLKKDNLVSAHILDNAGGFTQATMLYRDLFSKKSKGDTYNFINYKDGFIRNVNTIELDKKLSDDKRISSVKSENDIKKKCDLITADGGFGNMNENLQEQECPTLLIHEILSAVINLKKDGHFVCRFLESFTDITLKIISMLNVMFDKIYFCKPLMSKLSSTERYLVCMNFKYNENDKELKKYIDILEKLFEQMQKRKEGNNVVDIFLNYNLSRDIVISITNMNIIFSNEHIKIINEIIAFIRNQVFSGEEYHDKRSEQIEGSKYWTSLYLPKEDKINDTLKKTQNLLNQFLEISNIKRNLLEKSLVNI